MSLIALRGLEGDAQPRKVHVHVAGGASTDFQESPLCPNTSRIAVPKGESS
jgi:hypothetical protein